MMATAKAVKILAGSKPCSRSEEQPDPAALDGQNGLSFIMTLRTWSSLELLHGLRIQRKSSSHSNKKRWARNNRDRIPERDLERIRT
jgi:hypothetical protein